MPSINFAFTLTDEGVMKMLQAAYDWMAEFSQFSAIQEESLVQLGAALAATGKDAETSVEELAAYAAELQKVTKFADEAIIESSKWFAQMPRLDATSIKDYQMAAADLAEVMGVDLKVAAQVLSRALEDPRRASRALRRANVMLSTQQRRMLEVFDEAGMMAEAQTVIMDGVAASVGGAAEAMANTLRGVRGQVRGIAADLREHFGKVINEFLFPVTRAWKDSLQSWSETLGELNDEMLASEEVTKGWVEELLEVRDLTGNERAKALREFAEGINSIKAAGEGAALVLSALSERLENFYRRLSQVTGAADSFGAFLVSPWLGVFKELEKLGRQPAALKALEELEAAADEQREREREAAARAGRTNELGLTAEQVEARNKAIKEARRQFEAAQRSAESWINSVLRNAMSAEEQLAADMARIVDLFDRRIVGYRELVTVQEALVKSYWNGSELLKEQEDTLKAIAKSEKDRASLVERVRRLDARMAKDRAKDSEFKSSITSLQGLYESIAVGAASTTAKDATLDEMQRQRKILIDQLRALERTRTEQVKALHGVREEIKLQRSRIIGTWTY